MYYTGIGSREPPEEVLSLFVIVGEFLAKKGYILRSGSAQGADKAFEVGYDKVKGKKEIYLPWRRFEDSNSNLIVKNTKIFDIAKRFHPYWHNLSNSAKKLQARNSHQVLGQDLSTLSRFVICWTKGGSGRGGTGQATRIAKHYGIPVFDAGKYKNIEEIKKSLKLFFQEWLG